MLQAIRLRAGWIIVVAIAAIAALAAAWVLSAPRRASSRIAASDFEKTGNPDNGRLVFAAGDCASCHASPGQPDRLRLGGGIALTSPYGTMRAPNISTDPGDGVGNWSVQDLADALLSGVAPDGSHYYPVFPYTSFTRMTVSDVVDLYAYLRTLPAVSGRAPPHDLNPLVQIRRLVGFWKLLYFRPGALQPDLTRDDKWNRGRYLVEGISHCAECHSSRDLFGGIKPSTRFAGGKDPEGTGYYPNITPHRLGGWSEQDIVEMLTSGKTPTHGRVGSSMAGVVTNTAMLPVSDRAAIAAYIKSLPSRPTPRP